MTLYGTTKNTPATGTTHTFARSCDVGNTLVLFVQHAVSGTVVTVADNSAGANTWVKVRSTVDLTATSQRTIDMLVCVPTVAITSISLTSTASTSWVIVAKDYLGQRTVRDSNYYFGAGHSLPALTTVANDDLIFAGAYVATTAATAQLGVPGWTYETLHNSGTTQMEIYNIAPANSITGSQTMAGLTNPTLGAVYLALSGLPVPPTLTGTVLAADDFTGADNAAPAAQWTVTLAGTTPGTSKIVGNRVVLTPGVGAYSAAVTSMWLTGVAAVTNAEWDIMVTMVPDGTLRQQYMVLGMSTNGSIRSGDTLPGNGYGAQLFPSSNGFNLNRITSGSVVNLMGANGTYTFTAGVPVNVRIKMSGGSTVTLWIWNLGTAMPTTPTWTGTDTAPLSGTLKPLLSASNGAATTAIPAGFDDFSFASAAATQGWFISDGTKWKHYTLYVSNGTAWIAAPASETA